MAIRKGAEARDTVETVYNSFATLRAEDLKLSAVLYGRHETLLADALKQLGYKIPVPAPSPAIDHYAHDAESQLTQDLQWHAIDLTSRGSSRADALEVGAAWVWNKLDPGGRTGQAIKRAMVGRPFAGVWECLHPFKLPNASKRDGGAEANEKYRHNYFPMYLEVDNGRQSAFLEEGGVVSLAVRHYRKPLVRVLQEYDRKPAAARNPFRILGEDFPEFRAGYGLSTEDVSSVLKEEIEIWHLDDGTHICDYVVMPKFDGDEKHKLLSNQEDNEPWLNPTGRPLFHFASGFWNSDAATPEDRYACFIRALILTRYSLDLEKSILATLTATLPQRIQQLPVADLAEVMKTMNTNKERSEFMDTIAVREIRGTLQVLGELKHLDMPVPELLAKQIEQDRLEYESFKPTSTPDDLTLRGATASNLALHQEQKKLRYGLPQGAYAALVGDVAQDVFEVYRCSEQSHVFNTPKTPKTSYEKLFGLTTSDENVKGKKIAGGTKVALGPEELGEDESWYKLTVEPVDNSPQARQLNRMEAEERRAADNILDEEYFDKLGVPAPAEYMKSLQIQTWMAMFADADAAMAFSEAVRYQAAEMGMDERAVLAAMNGAPIQTQQGQMVTPRGPMQVAAPDTSRNTSQQQVTV